MSSFTPTFSAFDFDPQSIGRSDLVFGLRSGFINRSVHSTASPSVQRLRFVPLWLTPRQKQRQTYRRTVFDQLICFINPAPEIPGEYLNTRCDFQHRKPSSSATAEIARDAYDACFSPDVVHNRLTV